MAEKHLPPIDGNPRVYSEWPVLIERVVNDVVRILHSEAQILQTSIGAALGLQISDAVTHLTIVGMMISGAICLLCASILLLRSLQ